ncbi:hypothetical protein PLESTF_001498600 [Pleodorina starrii]|nr:hypothetical protein PLESTF_001498600 [Pleodorina starrii]
MSATAWALAAQQEQRRRQMLMEALLASKNRQASVSEWVGNQPGRQQEKSAKQAETNAPGADRDAAPSPGPAGPRVMSVSERHAIERMRRLHPTAVFLATSSFQRGGGGGGTASAWPTPPARPRRWRTQLPWSIRAPPADSGGGGSGSRGGGGSRTKGDAAVAASASGSAAQGGAAGGSGSYSRAARPTGVDGRGRGGSGATGGARSAALDRQIGHTREDSDPQRPSGSATARLARSAAAADSPAAPAPLPPRARPAPASAPGRHSPATSTHAASAAPPPPLPQPAAGCSPRSEIQLQSIFSGLLSQLLDSLEALRTRGWPAPGPGPHSPRGAFEPNMADMAACLAAQYRENAAAAGRAEAPALRAHGKAVVRGLAGEAHEDTCRLRALTEAHNLVGVFQVVERVRGLGARALRQELERLQTRLGAALRAVEAREGEGERAEVLQCAVLGAFWLSGSPVADREALDPMSCALLGPFFPLCRAAAHSIFPHHQPQHQPPSPRTAPLLSLASPSFLYDILCYGPVSLHQSGIGAASASGGTASPPPRPPPPPPPRTPPPPRFSPAHLRFVLCAMAEGPAVLITLTELTRELQQWVQEQEQDWEGSAQPEMLPGAFRDLLGVEIFYQDMATACATRGARAGGRGGRGAGPDEPSAVGGGGGGGGGGGPRTSAVAAREQLQEQHDARAEEQQQQERRREQRARQQQQGQQQERWREQREREQQQQQRQQGDVEEAQSERVERAGERGQYRAEGGWVPNKDEDEVDEQKEEGNGEGAEEEEEEEGSRSGRTSTSTSSPTSSCSYTTIPSGSSEDQGEEEEEGPGGGRRWADAEEGSHSQNDEEEEQEQTETGTVAETANSERFYLFDCFWHAVKTSDCGSHMMGIGMLESRLWVARLETARLLDVREYDSTAVQQLLAVLRDTYSVAEREVWHEPHLAADAAWQRCQARHRGFEAARRRWVAARPAAAEAGALVGALLGPGPPGGPLPWAAAMEALRPGLLEGHPETWRALMQRAEREPAVEEWGTVAWWALTGLALLAGQEVPQPLVRLSYCFGAGFLYHYLLAVHPDADQCLEGISGEALDFFFFAALVPSFACVPPDDGWTAAAETSPPPPPPPPGMPRSHPERQSRMGVLLQHSLDRFLLEAGPQAGALAECMRERGAADPRVGGWTDRGRPRYETAVRHLAGLLFYDALCSDDDEGHDDQNAQEDEGDDGLEGLSSGSDREQHGYGSTRASEDGDDDPWDGSAAAADAAGAARRPPPPPPPQPSPSCSGSGSDSESGSRPERESGGRATENRAPPLCIGPDKSVRQVLPALLPLATVLNASRHSAAGAAAGAASEAAATLLVAGPEHTTLALLLLYTVSQAVPRDRGKQWRLVFLPVAHEHLTAAAAGAVGAGAHGKVPPLFPPAPGSSSPSPGSSSPSPGMVALSSIELGVVPLEADPAFRKAIRWQSCRQHSLIDERKVTASSRWDKGLALVRGAMLEKRLGMCWIRGQGVEGVQRALLMAAQVAAEMRAAGMDVRVCVSDVICGNWRQPLHEALASTLAAIQLLAPLLDRLMRLEHNQRNLQRNQQNQQNQQQQRAQGGAGAYALARAYAVAGADAVARRQFTECRASGEKWLQCILDGLMLQGGGREGRGGGGGGGGGDGAEGCEGLLREELVVELRLGQIERDRPEVPVLPLRESQGRSFVEERMMR